jgi:hypothetical protein
MMMYQFRQQLRRNSRFTREDVILLGAGIGDLGENVVWFFGGGAFAVVGGGGGGGGVGFGV